MRRSESGKGAIKTILALGFLAAVAYCAIKIVPVYVNSYELEDYIRQQTPFWVTQRTSGTGVRDSVVAKARSLNLPVSPEQVQVEATGTRVSVALDYTVPVDLIVYTLELRFTPSAENRAL